MQRYLKEREVFVKDNWFSGHVASVIQTGPVKILKWNNPLKEVHSLKYVFLDGDLFISAEYCQDAVAATGLVAVLFYIL